MGLLASIKQLFAPPRLVTRLDDLAPGSVVIDGDVRLGADGPLASPIKGQPCVAFFYTATHRTPGRQAGMTERPLRTVEGFAPFELELDGGRIDAVPATPGSFDRDAHQKLAGAGYAQFQAAELIVAPRARVRLWGVAKRKDDRWIVTYRRIEKLAADGKKPPRKR
jgi:hypothetical protein